MDTSSGLLLGRPFGGLAILWRKSIGDCIQIHKYNDSRVMAIEYNKVIASFLPLMYRGRGSIAAYRGMSAHPIIGGSA